MLPYLDKDKKIPMYGVMMMVGIAICFFVLLLSKNSKISKEDKMYGGSFALIGGIVGAKLLSVITSINIIIEYDIPLVDIIKNGFVFYGGMLGGLLAITIYCLCYKIKLTDFFDCCAFVLPLGQAFGRVGCFLAGCCFGQPTDSIFGVTYHISADPNTPIGQDILPVQLFETAYCIAIFVILAILNSKKFKNKLKSGVIASLYMIIYSICRFVNEFFRFDSVRGFIWIFSTSQIISIFVLMGGILMLLSTKFNHDKKSLRDIDLVSSSVVK